METKKITLGLSRIGLLALLVVAVLSLQNCKKEETPATTTTTTTTTATNNMKATVDGESFQGTTGAINTVSGTYNFLTIYAFNYQNSSTSFKEMFVYLYGVTKTGTYPLGTPTYSGTTVTGWGGYYEGTSAANYTVYMTDSTNTGTVTITKYDAASKTISGTYSFTAKQTTPAGTATKKITNASFTDVKWY